MGTFDAKIGAYRKNGGPFSEKGTSDILGIWRGKMLCLEVKSRRGTLRPEQILFLQTMQQLGAIAGVVRSLKDAMEILGISTDAETYSLDDQA